MKAILNFIFSIIWCTFVGYISWLFIYWISPLLLGINIWLFLIYIFAAGGLFTILVSQLATFAMMPFLLVTKGKIPFASTIICTIIFLVWGYFAVKEPWNSIKNHEGILPIIIAVSLSLTSLSAFFGYISLMFHTEKLAK